MLLAWKHAGIVTYCGYILGFPNDTPESIIHDIEVIKRELPVDLLEFYLALECAKSGIELEEVSEHRRLREIVNEHHVYVWVFFQNDAKYLSSDAAEAVDSNIHSAPEYTLDFAEERPMIIDNQPSRSAVLLFQLRVGPLHQQCVLL
jgi:hypothetical protein